jgi:hypothetical protein
VKRGVEVAEERIANKGKSSEYPALLFGVPYTIALKRVLI